MADTEVADGPGSSSPFLDVSPADWMAQNRAAFAIRDAGPVPPGHSLVVLRRLIRSWWEVSSDERADMLVLVDQVKQLLVADFRPDRVNVGFNAGEAAG